MPQQDGLPPRGPGTQLRPEPQLPARRGGATPYQPRELTEEQVFPGRDAPTTIEKASAVTPTGAIRLVGALPAPGGPPGPDEPPELSLPHLNVPATFEELFYHAILLNSAREVPTIVEQTIAPGATGSTTISVPVNRVDVARTFREAGDGSVTYRIEVDSAGQTAIPNHRVTGAAAERTFARFWEKYRSIIITFTNNDLVNSALLQIEWTSIQVDTVKWSVYRENMRAWARLLGIVE